MFQPLPSPELRTPPRVQLRHPPPLSPETLPRLAPLSRVSHHKYLIFTIRFTY